MVKLVNINRLIYMDIKPDSDGDIRLIIDLNKGPNDSVAFCFINKDYAMEIVTHLMEVFKLKDKYPRQFTLKTFGK